jgi:hypothetical protein
MEKWIDTLKFNPIKLLLDSNNKPIIYLTKRDLQNKKVPPVNEIWSLPEVENILQNQQNNGSWKYIGKKVDLYPPHHYSLVSTFKKFRILIEKYELNKKNNVCSKAAEYIFSCQTQDGDFRGMIGNQYATYYTGYFISLLIKAGYKDDKRIKKGLEWLLDMRQDDGGWTIPILTHFFDKGTGYKLTSEKVKPVEPDKSQPFSHNWTNMVLMGFAEHPDYSTRPEILKAAKLLKSRFFQKDYYNSYKSAYYWVRFGFWWPNLLTALTSLYTIGFKRDDEDISLGIKWFVTHQQKDGMWNIKNSPKKNLKETNKKSQERRLWLTLNICRMLKNFYNRN